MIFTISEGDYNRMGVVCGHKNVIFTFEGEKESTCCIVLVDRSTKEEIKIEVPEEYCLGSIRSVAVSKPDMSKYYYYYEIDGKTVNDPYASRILGRDKWNDRTRYDNSYEVYSACDTCKFDWEGDKHPEISKQDMMLYKLHVRGFSKDMKGLGRKAGTFKAITEKIDYIKSLGFTSIELMPVYEFDEITVPPVVTVPQFIRWKAEADGETAPLERAKAPEKINYWGYVKGNYFAVKASYAYEPKKASAEFKELVKTLHANDMECIMEVFFDKNTNHNLIIDALRYWVREYHVDGFHLLGENIPINTIIQDVMLRRTKLMYADLGENGIPNQGRYKTLFVYKDEYMYPSRKLLNHMNGDMRDFLNQQKKQGSELGYVNYITSNNGFTLADLFMYNDRHNEANGENNCDGNIWNYSNNYGVEGPTRKNFITGIRKLKWRNAMMMLFLSQGVPMVWSGDEAGNSQQGNNNAYCQDNKVGWVNWKKDKVFEDKAEFMKQLIAFRKAHPIISCAKPFQFSDYASNGCPDMSYHGDVAYLANFQLDRTCVGLMYCGDYAPEGTSQDNVYIGYNFFSGEGKIALPKLSGNKKWYLIADSSKVKDQFLKEPLELEDQSCITLDQQSICILVGR